MDSFRGGKKRWIATGRSDLDWGIGTVAVRVRPKRRKWQCGDRKELRRLVSQFSRYSSMHGTHYLCSSDRKTSILQKTFYRLFIGTCLVMMSASAIFLAQDSFGSESVYVATTSKDSEMGPEEDELFPVYPDIVLCRSPAFKTNLNSSMQQLVEYAYLALGYPFTPLTPNERSQVVHSAARTFNSMANESIDPLSVQLSKLRRRYDALKNSTPDFNATQFIIENSVRCEDIFIRCIAFVYFVNCCKNFRPLLTVTGMCYNLSPNQEMLSLVSQAKNVGFNLIFDLQEAPALNKTLEVGYQVHISDPRHVIKDLDAAGQYIMNGFVTTFRSKMIKTDRTNLYTPWHGLYNNCPQTPSHLHQGLEGRYDRQYCRQLYLNKLMRDSCHCQYFAELGNYSIRICDPVDLYGCFIFMAGKDNLTHLVKYCREPCIEYTYESTASYVTLGGSQNSSRLIFVYDTQQYIVNEYKTTTVSSFLSQIGGAMGLYVGASIVTILELTLFAASWVWYRLIPSRRISSYVY